MGIFKIWNVKCRGKRGQVDPEVGGSVVFHTYFSTNDPWQFHNPKSLPIEWEQDIPEASMRGMNDINTLW